MATLTIRKIPDEQIQQLKEVAEKNNRSHGISGAIHS